MVKRITLKDFINKAVILHGQKFDYTNVQYVHNKIKVEIICRTHGPFLQTPNAHLANHGCPACQVDGLIKRNTKPFEIFIEKAQVIHNNFYDYSKAVYINRGHKIEIICPKHGKFEQTPKIHIKGHGCPRCIGSISKLENKWLDILHIPDGSRNVIVKVDNRKIKVDAICKDIIYEFYGDYWHGNPKIYDRNDVNGHNGKFFGELYDNTLQRENILKQAGYNIVSIWESDFKEKYAHNLRT